MSPNQPSQPAELPDDDAQRLLPAAIVSWSGDRPKGKPTPQISEALCRKITDLSPISIFIYDINLGTLTFCNPAYEEGLGYTLAEIQAMGENFLPTIYHPDNRELVEAHDCAILADRHGRVYDLEYACRRKDGSTLFVYSREVVLTRNPDGTPAQILGFGIDITARKTAETTLQQWASILETQVQQRTAEIRQALEFEATLKRITDRVRDSLDEDQILETVVQELGQQLKLAACTTGIYSPDQTTATITHEFTRSSTSVKGSTVAIANSFHADVYPLLLAGNASQFCELIPCGFCADQRQTILACPIRDDQAILGDLWLSKSTPEAFTQQEVRLVAQVANQCAIALRQSRLYRAAQGQVTELERLNRLKDDFLSTVSHELRTPMASIKMAIEMLEIQLKRLDLLSDAPLLQQPAVTLSPAASLTRYFQILKDESNREISLINDLLDLMRLNAQTDPLDRVTIELQNWIPHCLEAFVSQAQANQLTLVSDLPADLPPVTIALSYLRRILTELITNACKYTPPGETVRIMARATAVLEIRVSNSGVEIPVAERDRIFDRFYRIPNSDPWKRDGMGLGLALVKKLVDCLGGRIWVESGAGLTQFVIQLPLYKDH